MTTEISQPSDQEITITRRFRAPRARVFDAFTRPDRVKRWLHGPEGWALDVCEIDLREGGAIRDEEELINKAVGTLLREVGKKSPERLLTFLDQHAAAMPRVSVRYATEKLDAGTRKRYVKGR